MRKTNTCEEKKQNRFPGASSSQAHPGVNCVEVDISARGFEPNGASHQMGKRTIRVTSAQWDEWLASL